ncbi:hypothetical protein [Microbacterium sp. Bi128]|uniref:hypothetical protein n=1 Tax=Microbacterium sp. Bi128 TaxID=2821115 RepID=UPI001DAABF97|nr:hypothetical protein [Microbacterium sp. Bi128]CAH0254766.1 hypothetical protein SRABI128_02999 [Microbacterium sp. Bi128]
MPTDDRVVRADDPEKEVSGMSEFDVRPPRRARRCGFAWCTTRHGETAHPDDEAHRSDGVAFSARVRAVDERGPGVDAEVEVGLLRRVTDQDTWLVIEAASGTGLALTLEGARELRRVLDGDPQVRAALSS